MNIFRFLLSRIQDVNKEHQPNKEYHQQPDKENESQHQDTQTQRPTATQTLNNDFIQSGIIRRTVQGRNYIYQDLNIHGKLVKIIGNVSGYNPDYVEYGSKRPKELQTNRDAVGYTVTIEEFFNDFRVLYKFISETPKIDNESFIDCFYKLIDHHINKVGRIIDNDLYSYIDLSLTAKFNLWDKFYNHDLTEEEVSNLWIELRDVSFEKFKNFIFITKYDFSNPLNPVPSLIKLSNI